MIDNQSAPQGLNEQLHLIDTDRIGRAGVHSATFFERRTSVDSDPLAVDVETEGLPNCRMMTRQSECSRCIRETYWPDTDTVALSLTIP